jgi:hypothetical protein
MHLPRFVLAAALIGAVPAAAHESGPRSSLDVPVAGTFRVMAAHSRGKCQLLRSLEQVSRRTRVRLGFENLPDCLLAESARPSAFLPHEDVHLSSLGRRHRDPSATGQIDTPVSVAFPGGVLLEALNAVAASAGANWQFFYPRRHGLIALWTPDIEEGIVSIAVRLERAGRPAQEGSSTGQRDRGLLGPQASAPQAALRMWGRS